MKENAQHFYDQELNKSREELIQTIVIQRMELEELRNYKASNAAALEAMHKEFMHWKNEAIRLQSENKELTKVLADTIEKEKLRTNDIFGRGTEKLSELLGESEVEEIVDEAEAEVVDFCTATSISKRKKESSKTSHGQRSEARGSQKINLDALPQRSRFIYDKDELNRQYGEGKWRIAYWRKKRTLEYPQVTAYCLNTYTPVLSIGLEHCMESVPNPGILPGSCVSPSFLAHVFYERIFKSIPFYRQSVSFKHMGLNISRQNLTGWFTRFSQSVFSLIHCRMKELLLEIPYHQCDETFFKVNKDGRTAGSYSYMWVHRTSELYPCNPIILFCFELTRGTDHLRKFYKDFEGFITCDAYCSYKTLGKEKANVIIICGCMMHLRRRFAESLMLIDKTGLSDEMIESLPETQALRLLSKIYEADEKLKNLPPYDRKKKRGEDVKPLMDEFYSFIEDLSKEADMSSRLKDAVNYALNQKEYIMRFLEDGQIPIDDGATERAIRTFAISKRNSLFCDSMDGAEASAVMYSLSETAKANGANVYLYFRYLLEEIPLRLDDSDLTFLDAMMPWSEEYRRYEKNRLENPLDGYMIGEAGVDIELPRTPRKSKISKDDSFLCTA